MIAGFPGDEIRPMNGVHGMFMSAEFTDHKGFAFA
jgi:hypothetical protein